jgi:hypothetical protein
MPPHTSTPLVAGLLSNDNQVVIAAIWESCEWILARELRLVPAAACFTCAHAQGAWWGA